MTHKIAWLFMAISLFLAGACGLPPALFPQVPGTSPASPEASATPSPSATSQAPGTSQVPGTSTVPVATPTAPPTSPLAPATPAVDFGDLSPYQEAMIPQARGDVAALSGLTRYYIEITTDPRKVPGSASPLQIEGVERLLYTNNESVPLNALYLRLLPNTPGYGGHMWVKQVVLDGHQVPTSLESAGSALRVPLDPPLPPRGTLDLTMWFEDDVPASTTMGYNIFSDTDGVLALAAFYPMIPVYDAQGWHIEVAPPYGDATYTDVSLYLVCITAPQEITVVTSGSVLKREQNGDGTATWTAASGPMRDFYIVMSPYFQRESRQVSQTVVNSYYLAGSEPGGRHALEYASTALDLFNRDFGTYPYAEFDVVETLTTAGGVEYPGVVAIAKHLYESGEQGDFFEHATVHEVIHQWWYGLVGSDQVNVPWLDEALTNYSVLLYWEATKGQQAAAKIRETVFEMPYQSEIRTGRDRPVAGPVSSFSESDYGLIVYGKGPLFFDALRQRVGDATYLRIMQTYLQRYKYRIATPEDFLAVAQEVSGQSVADLYDKWILGAGP
jgi:hypothetical protein